MPPPTAPPSTARSRNRPGPPASPRLRLTRRARYIGRAFFGAASSLVLIAAGAGWYLNSAVLGGLATSNALAGLARGGAPSGDLNILLMGLDSRRDNDGGDLPAATLAQLHAGSSSDVGGYNTNTLILLHVPKDGSRAVALSIPRDDYVDLPEGLGEHKIKEAYGLAKAAAESAATARGTTDPGRLEQLGREAGRKAAIEAVRDLLGVDVDHFAEVNLAGFYDLANALGGVRVCLRHAVRDQYSGADFPAGVQTLDGAQSLAFVRQRHGLPNGDLDRTHRQQAFLASAVHQLRTDGVLGDLSRIGPLIGVARRDLVVDAGFDLLSFARRAGAVTAGNVTFYTLPIEGYATADGESVNVIDPVKVKEVTRQLLAGGGPADAGSVSAAPASGPEIPQIAQDETMQKVSPRHAAARHDGGRTKQPAAVPASAAASPEPTISAPPGVPCVD